MPFCRTKTVYILLILALVLTGCNYDSNGYPISETTGQSIGHPLPVTVNNTPNVTVSNATSTINATMFASVEGNGLHIPTLDKLTGALVAIDQLHNEVHEGEMFSWCNISTLGSGSNITILFTTPNSSFGNVHIEFVVESTFETEWMIHEGSNVTVTGTNRTSEIVNRSRLFADTPRSQLFTTPTVTSFGKSLCMKHWGSGRGVGGEAIAANEFILKPSTNYTFIATSFANGDVVAIELIWYLQQSMY